MFKISSQGERDSEEVKVTFDRERLRLPRAVRSTKCTRGLGVCPRRSHVTWSVEFKRCVVAFAGRREYHLVIGTDQLFLSSPQIFLRPVTRLQLLRLGMIAVHCEHQCHLMGTARCAANTSLLSRNHRTRQHLQSKFSTWLWSRTAAPWISLSKHCFRKRTYFHGTQRHGNAQQHHNDLPEGSGPALGDNIGVRTPHISYISNTCRKNISCNLQ